MAADVAARTRRRVLDGYLRLLPVTLAEFRSTGAFYLFFSLLFPAGGLFFVVTSGAGTGPDDLRYLAGGALAASLAMGPAVMLCSRLGLAREHREFDYWASLPVSKTSLVLALCTAHLVFSLPGVAAMLVLAGVFLAVPGWGLVGVLPLLPLATVALAGVGAFVGSRAPTGVAGTLLGNLMLTLFLFASLLMTRLDAYPAFLRPVVYLVPTTYVADAFRHLVGGRTVLPVGVDVAVLAAVAVGTLWFTHRRLDWRSR